MGKLITGLLACCLVVTAGAFQDQPFPKTLLNARFVYVRAYDGDEFNPRLLPEDRAAIHAVQDQIKKWGRFSVVYHPRSADLILMVMSRRSEDVLAVYDARLGPQQNYQWRALGSSEEGQGEAALVDRLRLAVERAESH